MPFTSSNHRTQLQQNVRNKQQLAKRFTRRLNATTNPAERTFLRNEISNCVKELKQFARQWSANDYGSTAWITTGYDTPSRQYRRTAAGARANSSRGKSRASNARSNSSSRSSSAARSKSRSANSQRRDNRAFSFAF